MADRKITPARRRALDVLAKADAARPRMGAWVSNRTSLPAQCVYWSVADWLVKQGLATIDLDLAGRECVRITDRGREVVADA